jgi:predicted lipid carrier protein YhbT
MFKQLLTTAHQKIVNNAPKILAIPVAFVPFSVQKKALSELLKRILAEAIEDDDLDFLEGKWLKIDVTDLKLSWYLSFAEGELIICETIKNDQADVAFAANVNELILIAGKKEDPDTLFFQRRLSITGDTELGLEVKNLLDNIDFDSLPLFANKGLNQFSLFIKEGIAIKV